MNNKNVIRFIYEDNTHLDKYNNSCIMERCYYSPDLEMETYHTFCKQYALALGFTEKTVEEWFD